MIGQDEEKVDDAGRGDDAGCLSDNVWSEKAEGRMWICLGAYCSSAKFSGSDGHVCGRLIFKTASFEDVLYPRGVLEVSVGFLQGGDGMIST